MSDEREERGERPSDDANEPRDRAPGARRGIPGKGFDAGTGYGGAGGDSAYDGESTYGGQAGYGGSTTRGAYTGGQYGRPDDPDRVGRDVGVDEGTDDQADAGSGQGER